MNTKERLLKYLDYKGITKADFYKKTGLSNGFLDKNANINSDKIEIIGRVCVDLNLIWLINGDGNMIVASPELEELTIQDFTKSNEKHIELQQIPLYDFSAVAGLTPIFDGQGNPIDYISIPGLPKVDGAVAICGDSMYPLLKSGDIVIFKTLNDLQNIVWGEMYLISFGNDGDDYTSVKYVKKIEGKPEYVELVSYNHHHAPMEIRKECIRAIALVKASVRFNAM